MSLELHKLRKRFGAVTAVDGVSLEVRSGEFFSLLGPSGCGKTTILRTVAGILQPDEGTVRLEGRDVTRLPVHARNMTLVFQSYALFPHLTVFENVAFGLRMRRTGEDEVRRRVDEALDLVRLGGFQARYPAQISGGQQQRVALARALVVHPAMLLLDEPLSNLDARLREEMRTEIRMIQRKVGITTILVTHDIHEAFALSDRIAVLNAGRVEQLGTPLEIYQQPRTRFVAEFAGQSNHFEGRVTAAEQGRVRVATAHGIDLWVAPRGNAPASDAAMWVMLRPERVRLGATGGANCFPARVTEVTYLGGMTAYRLAVGTGEIFAHKQDTGARSYAVGEALTVGWDENDCVSLAAP
jgi:ABC-type Fe3+/spermidine/putrescine transport system ATPase subunit